MNRVLGIVAVLLSFWTASFGKEPYVSLTNYAAMAKGICVCTVERDNGDGTVSVQVDRILKGKMDKREVLKGTTGHCVMHGPVNRFMKPGERYLVFLFGDNTVGRLGGILPVQGDTVEARFVDGFAGATFDAETSTHTLPLAKAVGQITALVAPPSQAEAQPPPAEAVRALSFDDIHLVNLSTHDFLVRVETEPPGKDKDRFAFTVTLQNFAAEPVLIREQPVYLGELLYFRDGAGRYATRKHTDTVARKLGPPRWLTLSPRQTHAYLIGARMTKTDPVTLETEDMRFDLGQPGSFHVFAMVEQAAVAGVTNAWVGRCVSPGIQVDVPRSPLGAALEPDGTEISAWFVNDSTTPQTYKRGLGISNAKHGCALILKNGGGKTYATDAPPRRELQNYNDIVVPPGEKVLIGRWDLATLRFSGGPRVRGTGQLPFSELPPGRYEVHWWDGVFQLGPALRSVPSDIEIRPSAAGGAGDSVLQGSDRRRGARRDHPPLLEHGVESPAGLLVAGARRGDNAAVERLLDEGTLSDARNEDGQSALELAVANGHRETVLLLLGRGAPLWGQNPQGESLLHIAVCAKQREMLELLLALGVPQGLADAKGRTPLDLARQIEAADMAKTLRRPPPVDLQPVLQEIERHRRVSAVKLAQRVEGFVVAPDGRRGWVFTGAVVTEYDALSGEWKRSFTNNAAIVAIACHETSTNRILKILTATGLNTLNLQDGRFDEQGLPFGDRADWRLGRPVYVASALTANGRHWWLGSISVETPKHGAVPPALFRVELATGRLQQIEGLPPHAPGVPSAPLDIGQWDNHRFVHGPNGQVLVTGAQPGVVAVFAPDGDKPIREFNLPHRPLHIASTADGALVTAATNELAATTIATGKVLHRVALPGKPTALCADAAGHHAFVATEHSDLVSVVDLRRGQIARSIEIVRPLGRSGADAGRGRSLCGIGQLHWADNPRRLIGLGYTGSVLFIARY